jgi:hypothetical protein
MLGRRADKTNRKKGRSIREIEQGERLLPASCLAIASAINQTKIQKSAKKIDCISL